MANKPVTQINKDSGRTYFVDSLGKELPSVTHILGYLDDGKSGALMGWAVKVMALYLKTLADAKGNIVISKDEIDEVFKKAKAQHKELKNKAADIGSETHNLIEVYLKGQKVDGLLSANPKLVSPFEAFKKWQKEVNYQETIATERIVYSETYGFAGTLDLVAKINGVVTLIDIKTSNRHSKTYFMQVAAYKQAYEELQGNLERLTNKVEAIGVLRLDKETGLPDYKSIPVIGETGLSEDYFGAFMCFVSFYNINQRLNKEVA